ncbi:RRM domain-containing protein [Caenorhabditis elegans]|uniref:RRM domain-containing protein n=1 Tax=Caenorhabditis elegans TaxID=6239 RepID=O45781_CAEEL|nr:RRM domain-containing protein [Caenorhabditis elegans]CAB03342.1 RRM domain-containing protein [Caenorhabditis elegans]|eukprot:NP_499818.1 Dietary Restriction Response (WT but not eat-2 lifespan increased) [Caenorhabditis elegans]
MADEIFKAFIGGLPYDSIATDIETILKHCKFTDEELKKFDIHLVHDRDSGSFKGFAYVTFENEQQMNTAISGLNGADFGNRVLKVNRAQQRDRSDRGGGRGGRGGNFGDRGGRGRGAGGFRRGGEGGRFNEGERRGGFGGGGHRGGYRQRRESEEQHKAEETSDPSAPPAERPRLNLKPRTTDAAEIEARKKQEEEETKRRQEKLFQ